MSTSKTVSLVLGSGGAKGYAHIGVIEELLERGYIINSISGTSMGALVGGLYAAGKLDEFKEWVTELDLFEIIKLVDLSFGSGGFIKGEKVFERIKKMLGDIQIEDLPIPFTAVATDIINQKEVWFQKGSLIDAIRASISIPSVFTPVKIGDKLLVDGGVLNPIPTIPALATMADITIAVSLSDDSPVAQQYQYIFEKKKEGEKQSIYKLVEEKIKKEQDDVNLSYLSIMNKCIDTMQEVIARHELASHRPDIMINISKYVCETYDFHKAKELIEYGKVVAKDTIENSKFL